MKIARNHYSGGVKEIVREFVDFLSPTYGPAGRKVLIQDNYNIISADDGKTAAQHYELHDEVDNAVVMYVKEAMNKTDSRVGDGTTTSAIILGAIVDEVSKKNSNPLLAINPHGIIQDIRKGAEEAVKQIKKVSKPIKTKEELYEVAYNSYNNEEIAKIISDTLFKVGKDGAVSIEDSPTAKTEYEIVEGMELDKGFASPYLVNEGDKVSLKNPLVLLANKKIESIKELLPVFKEMEANKQREILIIGEKFSDEVIRALVMAKMAGAMTSLLVENPAYGEQKLEVLKDIATISGGGIVDDSTNIGVSYENLGRLVSAVAKKDSTILVGKSKENVTKRVEEVKKELEKANEFEKHKLEKRIASLTGGVAILKVGANTENEQKTKKLKVEDAINATKSAFKDGIVKGGGKTFESIKTTSEVLNNALKAPRRMLEANGKEFLNENVYDPTQVLIAALESGVSIACGLLEIEGVIATKREKKENIQY